MEIPEQHREFAEAVAASRLQDPMPTFEVLSRATGVPTEDLVHHALVRWVSEGSEALMLVEPAVLRKLVDARARKDWDAVAGLIDWLAAGS